MFRALALILVLCPAAFAATTPNACLRKARAAIDLGSGTVKLNLAEVEACPERARVVRMLLEDTSRPLALEAGKTAAGVIPPELQKQTLAVLNELRDIAVNKAKEAGFKEIELTAVATHAVRTAQNQAELLSAFKSAGYEMKVLTQKEEAEAGLHAVQGFGLPPGCDPNSLLVWDIGGGSMQLTRSANASAGLAPNSPPAGPRVEGFNMGAEGFKQALLEKFKPVKTACAFDKPTPNPIGKDQSEDVRTFARDTTQRLLRGTLRRDLRATCVLGIGGVHSKAVSAQLEKSWPKIKSCVCKESASACAYSKQVYQKYQLECLARYLSEKSDCDPEIQGPYSSTAVTNLYLVLGWMDSLGVERVHTRPLNMGHHLVVAKDFAKFKTISIPGAK
jgi:hypothetical protein